jgi:hypothetical protein
MLNNKYNPDILNNYNYLENSYNNTKYELKNEPYKLIIEDNNKLKNNNFIINLDKNKENIIKDFDILYKKRKIKTSKKLSKKDMKEIKEKFKLKHTTLFNNNEIPDDYEDIKGAFVSDYKTEEDELKRGRNKYNNILDSLLEEGLLE